MSLMAVMLPTFYLPRRRVWARLTDDGLRLAFLADRYVDAGRELRQILDEVAARSGNRPDTAAA